MVLGKCQLVRHRTSFRRSGHLHTLGQLIAEVLHCRNAKDHANKKNNNPPANVRVE
jgi:hypothetical protein